MRFLITLSSLLALASATSEGTCEDCQAVVGTVATYLTSDVSLANQIDILLAEVCPTAEDPDECVDGLPEFWAKIAMIMWPGYWNADAEWMCATEDLCGAPQIKYVPDILFSAGAYAPDILIYARVQGLYPRHSHMW